MMNLQQIYGYLKESFTKKTQGRKTNDITKTADRNFYSVGDYFPNKESREGIVVFDGSDGRHPFTICGMKFQAMTKKRKGEEKRYVEFTFKEALRKFPTFFNHSKDEWYIPCAEELEQLAKLVSDKVFPARIFAHVWSCEESDYMSTYMAKSISICSTNVVCHNDYCINSKKEWKYRVLLFRQID